MSNAYRDYGELRVTMTTNYKWKWDDTGTGAKQNGSFWHPEPQGDLRPLGTVGIPTHHDPNNARATLLVGANPNHKIHHIHGPAVVSPLGYHLLWKDTNTGGKVNGSFWRPRAPLGYVALGDVSGDGHHEPPRNAIWCVRHDLVSAARYSDWQFWTDEGTGAGGSASLRHIGPAPTGSAGAEYIPVNADTFYLGTEYGKKPRETAYVPHLKVPKDYKRFDSKVPAITADTIPNKGEQFSQQVQAEVTLPLAAYFDPDDPRCPQNIKDPFCKVSRIIAWFAEGVWVNSAGGSFKRTESLKYGVTEAQTKTMQHEAGVSVTSAAGVGFANFEVSLNYQFTYSSTRTHTEFSEKQVSDEFTVPPHHAMVLFCKHVWIKVELMNGHVLNQTEFIANDDLYFSGVDLKEKLDAKGEADKAK